MIVSSKKSMPAWLTTGRKLTMIIVLLFFITVAIIALSIRQLNEVKETAQLISHTQEVLINSEKLLTMLLDNETNTNGYVNTGNKTFLEPLIKSKKDLTAQLSILKKLTSANPIQQERLDSLAWYINKRIAFSDQMIASYDGKVIPEATPFNAEASQFYTGKTRFFIGDLQEKENSLLKHRREVNERKSAILNRILIALLIFILVLMIFIARKAWIDFNEKKTAADHLSRLNDELELRIAKRTSELLTSKNSIEEILLRINDGFIKVDKQWQFTYINKSAGELMQQNPPDILGKNIWKVFPTAVGSDTYTTFYKAATDQQYYSVQDYYPPLGHWLEYHIYPAKEGLSVFVRNITETKTKQKELEESNQRFQFATKATSDAIWDWNLLTNDVVWGAGVQHIFGYSPAGSNGSNNFWSQHVHPEDLEKTMQEINGAIVGTAVTWEADYRFLKADDSYSHVVDRAFILRNKKGKAIRMVGAMQDISKRKEEENRLKLLESVITNTNDAIIITEITHGAPNPHISYINNAYTRMTGYTEADVIGKPLHFLQGPKTEEAALQLLENAISKKQPADVTTVGYKKTGEAFWISRSIMPVKDNDGIVRHWIGIERDITKNKNDELQKTLLSEISQVFLEPALLEVKLKKALQKILHFDSFSMAEIWLVEIDKKELHKVAGISVATASSSFYETEEVVIFKKGEGLPGITWQTQTTQYLDLAVDYKDFARLAAVGIQSVYAFPVRHKKEIIGVLLLALNKEESWTGNFIQLFENACIQLGAEIKRKQLEQELNQVFSFAPDIICMENKEGYFTKINPAASLLLEYTQEELLAFPFIDMIHPEDRNKTTKAVETLLSEKITVQFENRVITKSGKLKWLSWSSTPSPDGNIFAVAKDITERKKLEYLLNKASSLALIGSWEVDLENNKVYFSETSKKIHEIDETHQPGFEQSISFYKEGKDRNAIVAAAKACVEKGTPWDLELQMITAKGNVRWVRTMGELERINGKPVRLLGSLQDIHSRKISELAVVNILVEKADILESIGDAFFTVNKNWTITYWNKIAEQVLNKTQKELIGKNLWDVFPESKNGTAYHYYHLAMRENSVQHFEIISDSTKLWFEVIVYPSSNGLSVYFKDITQRKLSEIHLNELNEHLKRQTAELAASNIELEQYAFVASHDLQEPLRAIIGFLSKLEMKYGDLLDEKGKSYLNFAVNGARRMRLLILDLLDFSLVGKQPGPPETVDVNTLVSEIISMQSDAVKNKQAVIKIAGYLPVINTLKIPLTQLFQNLIANGVKYQEPGKKPEIIISATDRTSHWEFSVADNGIGIEPQYFEKIFVIFQRLHNKDDYAGTGIGLAISKKNVEKLGGNIWVDSAPGKGSVFYFTIPKTQNNYL